MSIAELLKTSHTIAVVGLSHKRFRPSNGVADYMQRNGYRIVPVNPFESAVLGETSYARPRGYSGACGYREHFPPLGIRA